jgi:hypothetical protein
VAESTRAREGSAEPTKDQRTERAAVATSASP